MRPGEILKFTTEICLSRNRELCDQHSPQYTLLAFVRKILNTQILIHRTIKLSIRRRHRLANFAERKKRNGRRGKVLSNKPRNGKVSFLRQRQVDARDKSYHGKKTANDEKGKKKRNR